MHLNKLKHQTTKLVKALEMCINLAKLHNILLGEIQSFLRFTFKHPDSGTP